MKKITLTLLASMAMLFVSCDESDDALAPKKVGVAAKISPPSWIVGSWKVSGASIKGLDFSNDDMCQVLVNDENLCYKESIRVFNNAYLKNKVEQSANELFYDVKIILEKDTVEYHFEKLDSLNVNWNLLDPVDPTIIKKIYKMTRK